MNGVPTDQISRTAQAEHAAPAPHAPDSKSSSSAPPESQPHHWHQPSSRHIGQAAPETYRDEAHQSSAGNIHIVTVANMLGLMERENSEIRTNSDRVGPVWSALLQQVSALGLGALGVVYATGMVSFAGQATALEVPRFAAYGYLSVDSILTRGLGIIFSFEFLGIMAAMTFVAAIAWAYAAPSTESKPSTAPTNEATKFGWGDRFIALILAVVFLGLLSWQVLLLFLGFGIFLLIWNWVRLQIPVPYRQFGMTLFTLGALLLGLFAITANVRPRLAMVHLELTNTNPKTEETGELWTNTDTSWVLVQGSTLVNIPTSNVQTARIDKAPDRDDDDKDLDGPSIAELVINLFR